jgi:arsenate reductase (thioredoxin)
MTTPFVLFVCLHGSAKSVIAEAHWNRLAIRGGLDVRATSAGTEPDAAIPPHVIAGLLADGLDVRGQRPRRAAREDLADAWRIVAFGCDLHGLAPPGVSVERWDDVPAVSEGFDAARSAIVARVSALQAGLR